MDLLFEPTRGSPFTIEVGYFDTVLEIKEKIQKEQGIPVSKQILMFNGNALEDDLNVHYTDILDRSHIQLIVPSEEPPERPNNTVIKAEESSSSHPSNQIQLLLKMPTSKLGIAMEMGVNETIQRLKEKIQEVESVPFSRLAIHANGIELLDHRTLHDYELSDNSEINVSFIRSSSTSSTSSGSSGSMAAATTRNKKLRIAVLSKCGTKKIPVEVNPSDNVGELRRELQKLNQQFHLQLPHEGYFFIYKQNVMDDDRSFRWHHVGQGDTIEIFNGSVSGGS